eukprot:2801784-Rhodomonas_salina.1
MLYDAHGIGEKPYASRGPRQKPLKDPVDVAQQQHNVGSCERVRGVLARQDDSVTEKRLERKGLVLEVLRVQFDVVPDCVEES